MKLAELLEAERRALLAGDFTEVEKLSQQKADLADSIESAAPDDLASLAPALERNRALLEAAQAGVRTVVTTLQQQRNARRTLSTYDRLGNAATITQAKSQTVRRF